MDRNEIHGQSPEAGAKIDITPWLGTWRNSNEKTQWIQSFHMEMEGNDCKVSLTGANEPADWGSVPATLYMDNIGELAFFAEIDLPEVRAHLAANMNKGLWVIAAFLHFKDENRPNFLCREFYYLDK